MLFFFRFFSPPIWVIKWTATLPTPPTHATHLPVTSRAPPCYHLFNWIILFFADKMGSNATKSQKVVSGVEDNSMALFNLPNSVLVRTPRNVQVCCGPVSQIFNSDKYCVVVFPFLKFSHNLFEGLRWSWHESEKSDKTFMCWILSDLIRQLQRGLGKEGEKEWHANTEYFLSPSLKLLKTLN